MGLTTRPSTPALRVVGHLIESHRDELIDRWSRAIAERVRHPPHLTSPTVERQLTVLVDIMIELAGPLRRRMAELWYTACDGYGRTAHTRGLATGEVVEELQELRELLIRLLSEPVVSLPARQAMAVVLRLNRLVDRGVAHAVVGYTDALVETLLNQRGVPVAATEPGEDEVSKRLEQIEEELAELRIKST